MAPNRSRTFRAFGAMGVACTTAVAVMSVPEALAAPVRYEAENATISQGVVESNHAGFSGAGFVNVDNVAGSSVEFTVTASKAGQAKLVFRYANGTTANRPVDVSVNGALAADERAFAGTGAWTTWMSAENTVNLNAGSNKIKLTSTGATGGPNLDYLEVEELAPVPALEQEAEDATISQGVVESNWAGFSGRGFVNYNNVIGSSVEYTINAESGGEHDLTFRYANGTTADRPVSVTVDGANAQTVSFPGTGAWTTWQTRTAKVTLHAGANRIKATATTANGGPNADKLTAVLVGPPDNEAPTPPRNLQFVSSTHNSVSLKWEAATDNVGVTGYDIYQHGQLVTSVGNVLEATATGLRPDVEYDWTVFAKDRAGNVSQASNNVPGRTKPAPVDNQAPTTPGTLRSTGATSTSVAIAWGASSDNVAVTGYEIHFDGVLKQTADGSATSATVAGLVTGQTYAVKVRAKDAAGNLSPFSNEISVKPTAGGGTGVPNPGTVKQIASGVDVAWGLAFLPDGSALVTERETFNVLRVTEAGAKTVVGKVPGAMGTNGEGGALGIEVSPKFASDRFVYVYHTYSGGNRLVRAQFDGTQLTGWTTLLDGVPKNRYHNGGRLRFSPDGRYLFISTGDAQNGNNAQNLNTNAGKILRLNADGSIPSDNPFPGKAIWSYGHRNVQGLDFDSQGRLWASEFGNSRQDEVNLITKGGNYGWEPCEGTIGSCAGTVPPKKTWSTSQASPSGLTIINDYVFVATTVGQRIYRMRIDAGGNLVDQQIYFQGTYNRLRTVEVDREGDIWLTTTTDKDGSAGNDRIMHIDIVYEGGGSAFKLSSPAFADDAMIPAKHTCAGDGVAGQDPSPSFAWGESAGAQAYAIVFADRVNNGNKLHWAIWDIPGGSRSLPENLGSGFAVPGQGAAKQKAMGSGANSLKYFGPCPGGSTNPYTFTLYALNTATVPGITSGSSMAQIETAIKNASVAGTVLRGRSNART
ncbi:Glucose/arabinose dehydrogenase, beta-propeller fold [Lentzea albidocapillata]|uniref:Glucose/arabinose dehydrogenase, beta-propeller fold n=2 Tax=Lentzea albidocapillata TaxID=40571 RepID=A0A1W2FMH1_9PSEU|nr:Glucose/arabinose dehydrogenase, beta-propeller fold [Lentzea albidocapillata]